MSDMFDNNQNYSAQSFGSPSVQPPKSRGSNRTLLFCGGCLGLVLVICCCCGATGLFAVRQPVGLAALWGTFITAESYDGADLVVCEGSQAARYTDQLRQQGAHFTSFNYNQSAGSDFVTGTGTLDTASGSQNWQGTFSVSGGGTFGRCIDNIQVTQ